MNKQQITKKFQDLSIAWATSNGKYVGANDGFDAKPSYHVHPDASYPHQDHVKKFTSLEEIGEYVKACELAAAAPTQEEAARIMEYYYSSQM